MPVEHHFAGMKRLMGDAPRADAIRVAIETRNPEAAPLDASQKHAMNYVRILTRDPASDPMKTKAVGRSCVYSVNGCSSLAQESNQCYWNDCQSRQSKDLEFFQWN